MEGKLVAGLITSLVILFLTYCSVIIGNWSLRWVVYLLIIVVLLLSLILFITIIKKGTTQTSQKERQPNFHSGISEFPTSGRNLPIVEIHKDIPSVQDSEYNSEKILGVHTPDSSTEESGNQPNGNDTPS